MTSSPTKPILVRVLDGPPGCGKSTHMRRRAANEPALTLFSAPTQQLLDEAETAIREFLAEAGKPDITVVMVTSDKLKGKKDRRVRFVMFSPEPEQHPRWHAKNSVIRISGFPEPPPLKHEIVYKRVPLMALCGGIRLVF